jgi:hypothetical protein
MNSRRFIGHLIGAAAQRWGSANAELTGRPEPSQDPKVGGRRGEGIAGNQRINPMQSNLPMRRPAV